VYVACLFEKHRQQARASFEERLVKRDGEGRKRWCETKGSHEAFIANAHWGTRSLPAQGASITITMAMQLHWHPQPIDFPKERKRDDDEGSIGHSHSHKSH